MQPQFIGPTYNLESRPASVQRTVNLVPVPVEPGNERTTWEFEDVPGLEVSVEIFSGPETFALDFPHLQSGDPGYPVAGTVHPVSFTYGPWFNRVQFRVGNASGVGALVADDYFVVNGVTVNPGSPATTPVPAGTVLITLEPGQTVTFRVLNTLETECSGSGNVTAFPV